MSPSVFYLLRPRFFTARNTWLMANQKTRWTYVFFAGLGIGFWAILFYFLNFIIGGFHGVEVFGPLLTRKLMEILLTSLFMMLIFSNVVTALSSFFLSEDLSLLLSLPISKEVFHYSRLLETLFQSGWMMALFGLPLFISYGITYEASWQYYLLLIPVLIALISIPSSIGVLIASTLVNIFPARKTREMMAVLSVFVIVGIFILIRLLRPEQLMDPEAFDSVAAYIAQLQAPFPSVFPPTWASAVLLGSLQGKGIFWVELGLLVSSTIGITGVCRWLTTSMYFQGWSKAQEARKARGARTLWMDIITGFAGTIVPKSARPLIKKDVRIFFRDPSQWSQIILLASLVVIYLFSINAIPMEQFRGPWASALRRALAFLNLGMAGFVMSGIAARFQFSAVSSEGRAFWIVRSSAVSPKVFLWSKSFVGAIPMIVVGEILAVASSIMLETGPFLVFVAAFTAAILAVGMSGIATAMGALYPNFKADNAAKVVSGPQGVMFMLISLGLVALVLLIEAFPVYIWLKASSFKEPLTSLEIAGIVIALSSAAVVSILAGVLPINRAANKLWERGL